MRGARVKALRAAVGFTYASSRDPLAKRAFRDLKDAFRAARCAYDSPDRGPAAPAMGQQAKYKGPRPYAEHWHMIRVLDPGEHVVGGMIQRNFHYEPAAVYVVHPVKAIGEFFNDMDEVGQTHALQLAEFAGRMPRHELARYYWQLRNNGEIKG